MIDYPWWGVVDGQVGLAQGDVLDACPILIPVGEVDSDEPEAKIETRDIVVMTQSCDIEHGKVDLVLVCPLWSLAEAAETRPEMFARRGTQKLRNGDYPGYHLLNRAATGSISRDFMVVDFHNVYGMPLSFLRDFARKQGARLQLLPPYREHLSQAFARFFMRVGLPAEITFDDVAR